MKNEYDNTYFDNRPKKARLEEFFFTQIGNTITASALVVTGPNVERHIPSIMKIINHQSCKGYCIENNKEVFYGKHGIQERHNKLTSQEKHKIKIGFGDVTGYREIFGLRYPCRFIDLDLCCTLYGGHGTSLIIANCLRVQASYRKEKEKCLMFTASLRKEGGIEEYLHELNRTILPEINVRIDVEAMMRQKNERYYFEDKPELGSYITEWCPVFLKRGRILKKGMPSENSGLVIYNYKETSQMITCAIMYK